MLCVCCVLEDDASSYMAAYDQTLNSTKKLMQGGIKMRETFGQIIPHNAFNAALQGVLCFKDMHWSERF